MYSIQTHHTENISLARQGCSLFDNFFVCITFSEGKTSGPKVDLSPFPTSRLPQHKNASGMKYLSTTRAVCPISL